jgi:WD40 repeat protein
MGNILSENGPDQLFLICG